MAMQDVFSRIPMPTWRWLGVNDLPIPAGLTDTSEKIHLSCASGEHVQHIVELRENGAKDIHIEVAEGAEFALTYIQLAPTNVPAASCIRVNVGRGGLFSCALVEAGASHTASELHVTLAGDKARADVWGLYFGDDDRKIDLNYVIRQEGRLTDANMQVRGALLDRSMKTFRGTLDFVRGTRGSAGREDEEVMILSPQARNRSVPLMLSHEADVDGHHAVSIGRMDEDKLFYLMSRGLDESAARQLVVEASFAPVLQRIADEELRAELGDYLERRLLIGTQE